MKLYIGEQIKTLRKEKGLTQEQLADALGVSYQSVSRWELGVCYPDMELLPAIANLFGVSIDELLANDPISKDSDIKLFYNEVNTFGFASIEQLKFIEEYVHKYPDNDRFAHFLLNTMTHYVLRNEGERAVYMPQIVKLFERLNGTVYREAALENMVIVCDEEDLDNWLKLCSWTADCTRRGYLVKRYNYRDDTGKALVQQGIQMFEGFAVQLDERFPDSFGPARKAEYHRAVLGTIRSFGDGAVPDGWGFFYAYKQMVLAACLFGDDKYDEGWQAFEDAMSLYTRLWNTNEEWLRLGNALFAGLKIRKDYTVICDENGNEHTICGSSYVDFCYASSLYMLLTHPAYAWFDNVRDTARFKEVVAIVEEWVNNEIG